MTALRGTSVLLVCLLLTGCGQTTINAYCKLAKPITYSRSGDTKPTVRQVIAHNAVWKSQSCQR